jgi:DNA-directed RNA polymerase specialized sigma24 family protein
MMFDEFVAWRFPAVLRFAAVLTVDRATAEDIVHEVLIKVLRRWDTMSALDRPELYVRKMIVTEYVSPRRLWRLVPSGCGSDIDDRGAGLSRQAVWE